MLFRVITIIILITYIFNSFFFFIALPLASLHTAPIVVRVDLIAEFFMPFWYGKEIWVFLALGSSQNDVKLIEFHWMTTNIFWIILCNNLKAHGEAPHIPSYSATVLCCRFWLISSPCPDHFMTSLSFTKTKQIFVDHRWVWQTKIERKRKRCWRRREMKTYCVECMCAVSRKDMRAKSQ